MRSNNDRHPYTAAERVKFLDILAELARRVKQGTVPVDIAADGVVALCDQTKHDVDLHTAGRLARQLGFQDRARALSMIALVHPDREAATVRFRDHFEQTHFDTAEKAELWSLHPEMTCRVAHGPDSRIPFSEWVQDMNEDGLVHGGFRPAGELIRWTLATQDTTVAEKVLTMAPRAFIRAMALSAIAAVTGGHADLAVVKDLISEIDPAEKVEVAVWYLNAVRNTEAVRLVHVCFAVAESDMELEDYNSLCLHTVQILAEMGLKDDMNRFIVTRNTTPYTTARARLIRYRYFSERCTDGLVALDDLGDPLEHDSTRCHMATIMADFDRIIIAQHCLAGLKKPHLSRLGQVRAHCAIYAAKQRLAEDQAARGDSST